jgi:hypothetical protein
VIDATLDHVGIVVPDLEVAMTDLAAQLGIEFVIVFDDDLEVREPNRVELLAPRETETSVGYGRMTVPPSTLML